MNSWAFGGGDILFHYLQTRLQSALVGLGHAKVAMLNNMIYTVLEQL